MNILKEFPRRTCYSARNMAKPVNFYCAAPGAQEVRLVGDFNRWNPTTHPMERRVDGWWFLQVSLTHGHHKYRFLVDGKPTLDPRAAGVERDEGHEEVSIVAVS
jgi:1,4-alpha-glucan branching enzyme